MIRTALLITLLLSSISFASAQSLSKTAAYIIIGDDIDLGDLREIDQDTVRIPGYMATITFLVKPTILKTINRQQCVVSTSPDGYNGPEAIFYFNNVIVKETTEKSQVPNHSTLYLKGEDYVLCILQNGTKNCLRQLEIGVQTDNLPRVYNAIKYLYANFCKSAERKNAF